MSLPDASLLIGAILLAAFALIEGPPVCADTDESGDARPVIELVDVTARTGITFEHVAGSVEKDWIAEVNGSGVALFDFDGDGDLDIYFVNCGRSLEDALAARESAGREARRPGPSARPAGNELWRNEGSWRFVDVTDESGVGDTGWGSGACVADVDNDGHLDLYVTNLGPNVLFRNRGDGTFERIEESGAEDAAWSAGASFADFDRDGFVDLYVANYIELELDPRRRRGVPDCTYKGVPIFCGPGGLEPAADSLFLSRGGGRFEDASEAWGIRKARASYGLGTIIIDLDQSGFPDIVVANDTLANFAFLNQNGKSLIDAALFLGLAYNDYGVAQAGMGLAAGDLRGTGREDIFVTNFEDDTNTLYRAGEKGTFVEDTWPAGLGSASYRYLGWGTFFFDVEGDGDLDLFIANGHIAPQVDQVRASAGYRQPNQLFVNDGKGKFEEDAAFRAAEEARKASSRGAAFGDLDGDGDPDVVVSNIDGPPTILENRSRRSSSGAAARWVRVKLEGRRSNRAAIGARVTLESGGTKQLRVIRSGESYASHCELDPIFALDPATQEARITIEWPAGGRQSIELGASERVLRVREE